MMMKMTISIPHHIGRRVASIFLIASIMAVSCSDSPPLVPVDETRDSIPLTEAQNLVPFLICLPTYLPAGIEMDPSITYHAEFGDPSESDIRLRFYKVESAELVVEIYQRHVPGISNWDLSASASMQQVSVRELLAWVVGWPNVDNMITQIDSDITGYKDGDMGLWLVEIVEPASLRANAIEWGNKPVFYRVYSRLSVEEVKKVVQSLNDCALEPTATP